MFTLWMTYPCVALATAAAILAVWVLVLDHRSPLNWWAAASALTLAWWNFWAPLEVSASDAAAYWPAFRAATTGVLLSNAVAVPFIVVLTQVPRPWSWVIGGLPALGCLVQVGAVWAGVWCMSGFEPTAWGNREILDPTSPWAPVRQWVFEAVGATIPALLAWAWWRHRSHRFRSLLLQYFLVMLAMHFAYWGLQAWMVDHLRGPDPSVLLSALGIANLAVLIRRYRLLRRQRPSWNAPLFQTSKDLVAVADREGRLCQVSDSWAQLWREEPRALLGRPVAELLPGWPGAGQPGFAGGEGPIGAGRFVLSQTSFHDKFQDLDGVLLRLEPLDGLQIPAAKYQLSARELEVVNLIAEGLTTSEVADALYIAPATVKTHLLNLYRKTETSGRVKLLKALQPTVE